jgi:MraZ protein
MLIGEYTSPLGEKNRIALPKRLRDQLGSEIIIGRGYEHCLIIVDKAHWQGLLTNINKKPLLSMSVRDTKRFLLGGAHELELDAQGRVVVPDALKKYASIDKEITFIGVGEWIEMWDAVRWEQKLADLSEHASDIADRLEQI